jgi:hypothetical protein
MSNRSKLISVYNRCLEYSNKLDSALQELSSISSKIYGKELQADICDGDEIEFRELDENGYIDSNSVILINEILKEL